MATWNETMLWKGEDALREKRNICGWRGRWRAAVKMRELEASHVKAESPRASSSECSQRTKVYM